MDPEMQKYLKILIKIGIAVLALLALYLLLVYLFPIMGKILAALPVIFLPFILALLMAVLIEPVVAFFEDKLKLKRLWAVVVSLLLMVGGLVLVIAMIISTIINELSGLSPLLLSYSSDWITKLGAAVGNFKLFYLHLNLPAEVQVTIQDNLDKATNALKALIDGSLSILVRSLALLPSAGVFIMIATVATFLIIKDRALLRTVVYAALPIKARTTTRNVLAELFRALTGFVKAYSILITITAIITIISLKIMGISYALTIGMVTGLLDILPVLGPGLIFIPWIAGELIAGSTRMGVELMVVYLFISIIRQFLEPKIVGDNIGLHPLATLMSLYIGLQLGGFKGMIMGPVLVIIFMAAYKAGVFDSIIGGSNNGR